MTHVGHLWLFLWEDLGVTAKLLCLAWAGTPGSSKQKTAFFPAVKEEVQLFYYYGVFISRGVMEIVLICRCAWQWLNLAVIAVKCQKKIEERKQNIPHIYFVDDEIHFKDTYNYLAKQKELIVVVVMPLMEATLPTHGAAIFENVFCNTH